MRPSESGSNLESTTRSALQLEAPGRSAVVPCLTVLWHPDPRRVGELVPLSGLLKGRSVGISRLEPSFAPMDGSAPPSPLEDPFLSRQPFYLVSEGNGGLSIERGAARTVLRVQGELLESRCPLGAEELEQGVVLLLAERVVLGLHFMELRLERPPAFGLVGESDALVRTREEIVRLAGVAFPVLLRGESGTGKELVARALHDAGPRRRQPFVSVNMGALPPTLACAEIFGAARGAYTGAERSRAGYFRQADGGTLFLDELGEMPQEVQALLYRVLESGRVHPVGATSSVDVDVRVVAATDADLEQRSAEGTFRAPLLHRLSTYELELAPLRHRREDFGRLFLHFLRRELEAVSEAWRLDGSFGTERPWIPAPLVSRLAIHPWPGNVRQVRNVVRQLVVRSQGEDEVRLTPKVERLLREIPARPGSSVLPDTVRYRKPGEIGRDELMDALRNNRWHVLRTAEQLGVSRTTLYSLMEACPEVRKASELSREDVESCRSSVHDLDALAEELEVSKHGLTLRLRELDLR